MVGRPRTNATLHCKITGNPVPAVKWVLNGRIIQNNTVPLHSTNQDKIYFIEDVALSEGEIGSRNFNNQRLLHSFPMLNNIALH